MKPNLNFFVWPHHLAPKKCGRNKTAKCKHRQVLHRQVLTDYTLIYSHATNIGVLQARKLIADAPYCEHRVLWACRSLILGTDYNKACEWHVTDDPADQRLYLPQRATDRPFIPSNIKLYSLYSLNIYIFYWNNNSARRLNEEPTSKKCILPFKVARVLNLNELSCRLLTKDKYCMKKTHMKQFVNIY